MEEESISHINSHLARHPELVEGQTCDPVKFREDSALTREGYKKTKLGWIPEDWRVIRLGEVCSRKGDYGINAAAVEYSSNLPTYLRITDISPEGNFIDIDKKSVDSPQSNNFILEDNDIVFARTGASVGKSYIHKKEDGKLVFAGFLIRFRTVSEVLSPKYLSYYVQTNKYWNWVKVNSMRSGQPGINSKEYCDMPLPIPPYPEQQKIATILSTWDSVIAKQEQLIIAKQEFKKGLMQLLLTGKKRFEGFEGKWETPVINTVFDFLNTNSLSRNQLNYDDDEGVYNIHYGDIHATYEDSILNFEYENKVPKINKDVLLSKNVDYLKSGDLIIADASEDYEGIGEAIELANVNERKVVSGLHTFAFRDKTNKTAEGFRSYIFRNPVVKKTLKTIATGSKVYGISKGNIQKFRIVLPTLPEQQKIASVLSAADKEIGLLQSELAELRGQKRGLMQVLLTGKKRVQL